MGALSRRESGIPTGPFLPTSSGMPQQPTPAGLPQKDIPPMNIPRRILSVFFSPAKKIMLVAAATLVLQGCGTDTGPPPDQTAKNNPPAPEKQPVVKAKGGGGVMKVKSIKDRS